VGDGRIQWTKGSTIVEVMLGKRKVPQKVLLMETSAFDLVLGMDFLNSVDGLLFKPTPRLVVEGEEFPLGETREELGILRRMTSLHFQVSSSAKEEALKLLGVGKVEVDLFPKGIQKGLEERDGCFFLARSSNPWSFDWGSLSANAPVWAQPSPKILNKVITKCILDKARMILVYPDFARVYPVWKPLVDSIACLQVMLPSDCLAGLPEPPFRMVAALVDGSRGRTDKLNPTEVSTLHSLFQHKTLENLRSLCYPSPACPHFWIGASFPVCLQQKFYRCFCANRKQPIPFKRGGRRKLAYFEV
jgi:hypothetical protein